MDEPAEAVPGSPKTSRRGFLKGVGAGLGGLAFSGTLSACAGSSSAGAGSGGSSGASTIKIGFVSPRTGAVAAFAEADGYVLGLVRKALAPGLTIGAKTYAVEIVDVDSQSSPVRGAQVANDLIYSDMVDLMVTTSTPETVNPVADACEAAGVPCISTNTPWEAFYYGRGAKPGAPSPFKFTYHYSFGVAQFAESFLRMWPQVDTNKRVAVMWPNDADGNVIRPNLGPTLTKAGYTVIDPGAYTDGTNDFSAQIATLFFAGWLGPWLPPVVWFLLKTLVFLCFFIFCLREMKLFPIYKILQSQDREHFLKLRSIN